MSLTVRAEIGFDGLWCVRDKSGDCFHTALCLAGAQTWRGVPVPSITVLGVAVIGGRMLSVWTEVGCVAK